MTVREPKRDDTKRRIIEGARELFGQRGFDATTVRQIAKRVGLTDAALYYHFKSKREILESIWDLPVGGSPAQLRPDGRFGARRLREIIDSLLDFATLNQDFLRLVNRETLAGDETARAIRYENRAYMRRIFGQHLQTIHEPDAADIRADALVAFVMGSTMRLVIATGDGYADASADPVYRDRLFRGAARIAGLNLADAV